MTFENQAIDSMNFQDFLWLSYKKMVEKHGSKEFNFLARTYVLPEERNKESMG